MKRCDGVRPSGCVESSIGGRQPCPSALRHQRDALVSELKRQAQSFVTFIGFASSATRTGAMPLSCERSSMLDHARPIVNTGTDQGGLTPASPTSIEGQGHGLRTTGIHPSVALRDRAVPSFSVRGRGILREGRLLGAASWTRASRARPSRSCWR
jgi:hypothetical protein